MHLNESQIKGLEELTGGKWDPINPGRPDEGGLINSEKVLIEITNVTNLVSLVEVTVAAGEPIKTVFNRLVLSPNKVKPDKVSFKGPGKPLLVSRESVGWGK